PPHPFFLFVFALFFAIPVGAAETDWFWGAATGEKLRFKVSWLGVPAGEVTLQLSGTPDGPYTAQASVATAGAVRVVHVLDEWRKAEGHRHDAVFAAQQYVSEQHKGAQTKWTSYLFDREMREVVRLRRETGRPDETRPIPLGNDQVGDPLSGFYALRAWPDLLPGHHLARQVVDGEKVYCLAITAGGSRLLHTELGDFNVFSVQVVVENTASFRQKQPILVWLTDDARRIPVQVEAQLVLGSMVAELVAFEDGRGEHRAVPTQ
ncbi:MAG: DUF3108 domain-containing protein, partial [Magnetococcales bacterium]|nr:DUF3108 domain-containing protein [Magnetococcales bacterium]